MGRFRAVVVTLAAGLTAASLATPALAAAGDASDFYSIPDPLPTAKPGSLIRAVRIEAPDGATAWRVLYHSRAVDGHDIAVSGLVVAPTGKPPKGGRPVVSWAHGTTGIADECAPSKRPTAAKTLPYVDDLVRAGYVVAATDYQGLGTPGVHPYLVGESEGRNVLDAARAARRVDSTGAGRDLLVFGHSQGGHAALFAGELAGSYAPELRLRGVVAAAPVADLDLILPGASVLKQANVIAVLAAKGFQAAYAQADPATLLTPEAISEATIADEHCLSDVAATLAASTAPVFAGSFSETPPWPDLVHANSAGNRPAGAPVLVVQGASDSVLTPLLSDLWVKKACGAGDLVDYRTYPGADHSGVIAAARDDVLSWFAARRAGDAARNTCP